MSVIFTLEVVLIHIFTEKESSTMLFSTVADHLA